MGPPAGTDFLVIGSGIAGLRAALDLADEGRVTVLTKADPDESNTGYAQGGIAAAVGADDSPEEHFADTMAAGDGLADPDAVRVLVEDGLTYVQQLVEWGARFDRDAHGMLALGREGLHRARRVLHARDATGREIGRLLRSRACAHPRVRVVHHARAVRLMVRGGRCVGALYRDPAERAAYEAGAVLLATGGAGQVYSETTNPPIATGDGIALAYRAGARVVDLEFVQFHPTALAVAGAPRFLLSEALRGEGARLLNSAGQPFLPPGGELQSRDVVARAIVSETSRSAAPVFLSMAHLDPEWVHARFPTISAACRSVGLDLARDPIPVGPAAHYIMGGVETDVWGRTTLPGLFAAGEVACTGVHGANRLASNSLLEGLVFGARAAIAMRQPPRAGGMTGVRLAAPPEARLTPGHAAPPEESTIRRLMWDRAGLHRSESRLEEAVEALGRWQQWLESRNAAEGTDEESRAHSLTMVGWLIARAALRRRESRGAHFRADFPQKDDLDWKVHVAETR
jgi:L-aspartate oxidase